MEDLFGTPDVLHILSKYEKKFFKERWQITEDEANKIMKQLREKGTPYRTCGTAFIVQKDHAEAKSLPSSTTTPEDPILEDMSKDHSIKGACDPMPPFHSAEMRLIELAERRLHPMYRMMMLIPKKEESGKHKIANVHFGQHEFPPHLKIDKKVLEKKNIMFEIKRMEPPNRLVSKSVNIKKDLRPNVPRKDCRKKET